MKKIIFIITCILFIFITVERVSAVDASNADNVTCTYGTSGVNTAFDIFYNKKNDSIEIKDRYASVDAKARQFMNNNKSDYIKLFKNGNSLQCSQNIKCNCPSVGKCQVWIGDVGYEYTYLPELQTGVLTSKLDNQCQLKSTTFGADSGSINYDKTCTFTAKDSVNANHNYTLTFQYDTNKKIVSPIKITSSKYKNAKYEGTGSSTVKEVSSLNLYFSGITSNGIAQLDIGSDGCPKANIKTCLYDATEGKCWTTGGTSSNKTLMVLNSNTLYDPSSPAEETCAEREVIATDTSGKSAAMNKTALLVTYSKHNGVFYPKVVDKASGNELTVKDAGTYYYATFEVKNGQDSYTLMFKIPKVTSCDEAAKVNFETVDVTTYGGPEGYISQPTYTPTDPAIGFGSNTKSCKDILGPNLTKVVKAFVRSIQIIGAIIAIVKGMMVLFPAIIAKDAEGLKKAGKTLTTMAIILAIIFLMPGLIRFIGKVAGFDISCLV